LSHLDQTYKDDDSVKFLNDDDVKRKLANTKKLSEVSAEDYDAIFYIGGLGPAVDLATDLVNAKLASEVRTNIC
jgi:putative intracellular protease/amidase